MIGTRYAFIFRDGSVVVFHQLNDAHARQSAALHPNLRMVLEGQRRVWPQMTVIDGGRA